MDDNSKTDKCYKLQTHQRIPKCKNSPSYQDCSKLGKEI